MIKTKTFLFCIILAIIIVFFSGTVKAEESFSGGQGSNLTIKNGVLKTEREDIDIKLHAGFAEVKQTYVFKNEKSVAQQIGLGFSYRLNPKNTGLDNITILIDNIPSTFTSTKEVNADVFTYWKIFETEFAAGQTRKIQITYWQLNGASLRGMRSFFYNLKNKLAGPIGEFNLKIYLMDSLNIEQFNKNINPDLDLKLEPLGWTNQDTSLAWQWHDFTPNFDILANFYWPNGDLTKISQLNQNIGLYNIKTNLNQTTAYNLSDSSYLTSWQVENFTDYNRPAITINFDQLKNIEELRIIPGVATSTDDFQNLARPKQLTLTFDDLQTKTIELTDQMSLQTIKLPESINAKKAKIAIESIYPGKITPNTVAISEIEFGSSLKEIIINTSSSAKEQSIWNKIFVQPSKNIVKFFKNIF
jgi:hypothetical protein